jgi:uncharacterized protein YceK
MLVIKYKRRGKMKRIFILMLIMMCLSGCSKVSQEEHDKLNNDYNLLNKKYDDLYTDHTGLQTDYDELKKKHDILNKEHQELVDVSLSSAMDDAYIGVFPEMAYSVLGVEYDYIGKMIDDGVIQLIIKGDKEPYEEYQYIAEKLSDNSMSLVLLMQNYDLQAVYLKFINDKQETLFEISIGEDITLSIGLDYIDQFE